MDETQELVSPNHYLFFSSTLLFSQKNELSFSVGGIPTSDQRTAISLLFPCPFPLPPNCNIFNTQLQTDPGVALQVAYTRHVVSFGPASLYAEFPLVGVLSRDIRAFFTAGPLLGNSFTVSSSALFFTPSARLKLFDSAPISAFVSVGGGLAHTGVGSTLSALVGPSSTSQNSGALQFGGGLDFRLSNHIQIRAIQIDYNPVHTNGTTDHNLRLGAGIVF